MGEKGNGRKRGGAAKPIPGTGKRSIGAEGAVERRKRMEEERRWEGRKEGTSGLEGTQEKVREGGRKERREVLSFYKLLHTTVQVYF